MFEAFKYEKNRPGAKSPAIPKRVDGPEVKPKYPELPAKCEWHVEAGFNRSGGEAVQSYIWVSLHGPGRSGHREVLGARCVYVHGKTEAAVEREVLQGMADLVRVADGSTKANDIAKRIAKEIGAL